MLVYYNMCMVYLKTTFSVPTILTFTLDEYFFKNRQKLQL